MQLYSILQKSSSWEDIHSALSPSPKSGKLFEEFCRYYFLTEPSVKDEYKNVWLFDEVPQEIKKRLNLGAIDHGVDLVLADNDDKYTVVQCKYRANQDSILSWSKDKLANLLADGEKAEYKIVFTNASGLDQHTLSKQIELLSLGDLLSIEENTISAMRNLSEGRVQSVSTKAQPRDYQINILKTVYNQFQTDDRGQLILPCGAGKTLTSLWIKEKLNSKNTIVVVPSLALLRQTKYEWSKHQASWEHYLCVCSEKDIDQNNDDMPIVHPYELGTHVTTDSNEIKDFVRKYSDTGTIIYSTYQSLAVVAEAIQGLDFSFDLLIADEAHKTTGSTATVFGLVHDNNQIPANKRLYMTATPRILSPYLKNKLTSENEYIADMSNSAIYGDEFYRMSFKEAIDKGILVDYQIVVVGVSDEEIKEAINKRKFVSIKQETIEDVAHNYALEKIMSKYNATHAITFHSTVKRAKDFNLRHGELVDGIYMEYVSGEQTTNHRNTVLHSFKNAQKGVISNARCLTEGIDVPAIDVVYFCDPKNSKVDIVQAVGRALRHSKTKQKEYGYVVVPIFYSHKDNIEKTIDSSAFRNLINVVRAMCDQDERLQDEINTIKMGKGARNPSNNSHISVSVGENINDILVFNNFEEKLKQSLFDEILERTVSIWEVRYNELCQWLKNNDKYPPSGHSLYNWVATQRNAKKRGVLSTNRVNKLNEINFVWQVMDDNLWENNFQLLLEFRKNNPAKWPAQRSTEPIEHKLAVWFLNIRSNFRRGILHPEYKKQLDNIGFPFNPVDSKWHDSYSQLKDYLDKHNKLPSNTTKNKSEQSLYLWLRGHKEAYQTNKLDEEKKDLLKQVNFDKFLEEREQDPWEAAFEQVVEFIKNNNKWPVNNNYKKEISDDDKYEMSLATWCSNQRSKYKKNLLSSEQIQRLQSMNFVFDTQKVKEDKWDETFNKVVEYRKNNPDRWPNMFSKTSNEEKKLGMWLLNCKNWYNGNIPKNGPFPKDRYEKLKAIGFEFEIIRDERFERIWNENYEELKEYLTVHNQLPPVPLKGKGSPLYVWLQNQKKKYREHGLTKEQIEKLQAIEIDLASDVIISKTWDKWYSEVKEYLKKHNGVLHFLIDGETNPLYSWVQRQKNQLKLGELTDEQVNLLQSLGISLELGEGTAKQSWNEWYVEIEGYLKANNGILKYQVEGKANPLYKWVDRQKKKFKSGKLTDEQIEKLKTLGILK